MQTEQTSGVDMPSANGYALVVTRHSGATVELVASWPAPFFALVNNCDCERPLLYHAESRAAAERFLRTASSGGCILNHDFTAANGATQS